MKKAIFVSAMTLMLCAFALGAQLSYAGTDGIYTLTQETAAWDGTLAGRMQAASADYNYAYGDEESLLYRLPWSFTFYGQAYDQINADTNGNIWFTASGPASSFDLPGAGRGPVISAWNHDLSSLYYSGVFVQHKTNPERVVVEWRSESYSDEGNYLPNNFELVLFQNGQIRFDYRSFAGTTPKDFGSGISMDDNQHYLNLSAEFGEVYTLAGRSYLFASSAPQSVMVTPSAGANGSISPSTPQTLSSGQTTTFTVTPDTGYHTDTVSGCGGTLNGSVYATGPVTSNCTVTATFAINTYTIAATAGPNGSIVPSGAMAVNYGGNGTFSITPDSGYIIADVLVDELSVGLVSSYTFTNLTADHTISATFSGITYTVTPSAGANGSISPSTPQTISSGQTTSFTVTPDTGHHIDMVSGCSGTLAGNIYTTGPITADCAVAAGFAVNTYTITASSGSNGSISPSGVVVLNSGATRTFTITPNTGYSVSNVLVDGSPVGAVTTYTFANVTANHAIMAVFAASSYTLTVNKAGTGTGAVTSSPAGISCGTTCASSFNLGTSVTLTATPAADSQFAGWSGACAGTGSCVVTMSSAQTTTATFNKYITVTAPNGGETWNRNSTYAIQWNYTGNPGTNVKIELLKGGVFSRLISGSVSLGSSGSGSYNWTIPGIQATGTDYAVRITSTSNANYTDRSNANFTIQ